MNSDLLMPFYRGSLTEDDRLKIERQLLVDSELLVDFLDLKRELEGAEEIPAHPSPRVWRALQGMKPRKKFLLVSLGVAVAAGLALAIYFKAEPPLKANGLLFDSSSELRASSSVL